MSVHDAEGAAVTYTTSSHKGEGVGSPIQTERHTFYGWGRWWISQLEFEKYRDRQIKVKRARKAGFDYTQLDDYLQTDRAVRYAVDAASAREKEMVKEGQRLKKKYGLAPNCNRRHLQAAYNRTRDPEIAKYLKLLNESKTTDTERIAIIRKTFMSGINPYDMLHQIALTVGIELRKKP